MSVSTRDKLQSLKHNHTHAEEFLSWIGYVGQLSKRSARGKKYRQAVSTLFDIIHDWHSYPFPKEFADVCSAPIDRGGKTATSAHWFVCERALEILEDSRNVKNVLKVLDGTCDWLDCAIEQEYQRAVKLVGAETRSRERSLKVKPLTDSQQAVYDVIAKQGPLLGRQIVKLCGLESESVFTAHYVPALKRHGVKNLRDKRGYFIDEPSV
jgi:hypothetical protein